MASSERDRRIDYIEFQATLEAAERAVTAAGGVVTERHEFPGGRRFHFRDPVGNTLAVWTEG